MEGLPAIIGALVIGCAIGYGIAMMTKGKKSVAPKDEGSKPAKRTDWWESRKTLTGTQLQILQYMEAKRDANITALQEKFSFIPDRELFYRLEQIVLMGFLVRDRKDGEVMYVLNPDYSGTVEDDKTVMLSSD